VKNKTASDSGVKYKSITGRLKKHFGFKGCKCWQ